jgi:hypothetical protein
VATALAMRRTASPTERPLIARAPA